MIHEKLGEAEPLPALPFPFRRVGHWAANHSHVSSYWSRSKSLTEVKPCCSSMYLCTSASETPCSLAMENRRLICGSVTVSFVFVMGCCEVLYLQSGACEFFCWQSEQITSSGGFAASAGASLG